MRYLVVCSLLNKIIAESIDMNPSSLYITQVYVQQWQTLSVWRVSQRLVNIIALCTLEGHCNTSFYSSSCNNPRVLFHITFITFYLLQKYSKVSH